jgi:hypothetical protein
MHSLASQWGAGVDDSPPPAEIECALRALTRQIHLTMSGTLQIRPPHYLVQVHTQQAKEEAFDCKQTRQGSLLLLTQA